MIVGSFAVGPFSAGPAASRQVRLDIQVLSGDGEADTVAQTGTEADLFALVAATGRALRHRLGVDDNSVMAPSCSMSTNWPT